MAHLRKTFRSYSGCGASNQDTIDRTSFLKDFSGSSYIPKYVFPRLFNTIDTKKDGVIDIDEYLCCINLFRTGSIDDRIKLLFVMYAPPKAGGIILRDNLRSLIKDANCMHLIHDLHQIDEWMEYSAVDGKLTFPEFCCYAKGEPLLFQYIDFLASIMDKQ